PRRLAERAQPMPWRPGALRGLALLGAGVAPARRAGRREDADRLARPISPQGTVRDVAQAPAEETAAQMGPGQAGPLLAEAEQWARAIGRSDLQAAALASVKVAAAQIDPDQAGPLLAEPEQYARTISG